MTFKDITKMSHKELFIYEGHLLQLYEETFGESYGMLFFHRPTTEEVVPDLIRCIKTGQKKVWPEMPPLPEGSVI